MSIERESPTWRAVKAHCETRIEQGRRLLEVHRDPTVCAEVRGEILGLRAILALADDKPIIADTDQLY